MSVLIAPIVRLGRSLGYIRNIFQVLLLGLAFLLPFITWQQAAGCVVLALLFVLLVMPHVGEDSGEETRLFADFDRLLNSNAEKGSAVKLASVIGHLGSGLALYLLSVLALVLIYRHSFRVGACGSRQGGGGCRP